MAELSLESSNYTWDNVSVMTNNTRQLPTGALWTWSFWYGPVHGYFAPIVCVFGVVANVLNFVVLTQKNMVSPTNVLLSGLALSDGLTMAAYLPYAVLTYLVYRGEGPLAYARFLMFYAIFSVIVHSISIWLTVSLAVFRFIFIRYPRRGAKMCTVQRAKTTIMIVSVITSIVCIPNSVIYRIKSRFEPSANSTLFAIEVKRESATESNLAAFNSWVQALLVKLLPCLLLLVLSMLLIKAMKDAEKRRKRLLNKPKASEEDGGGGGKRNSKTNRTTRMLLTVVILFLITETPQGILQLLSATIENFFDDVYVPLGDLMDILALINNGVNFILYCSMSKQFRDTFIQLFLQPWTSDVKNGRSTLVPTQATRDSDV